MLLLLLLPAHSSHRCRFAWAYKRNSCAYPAHLRLWKRVNARKHIHYWCTLHMLVWGDPIHHHQHHHRHQKKMKHMTPPRCWCCRRRHCYSYCLNRTEHSTFDTSVHVSRVRAARETAKMCECVLLRLLTIIQPKQAKTYPTNMYMYMLYMYVWHACTARREEKRIAQFTHWRAWK